MYDLHITKKQRWAAPGSDVSEEDWNKIQTEFPKLTQSDTVFFYWPKKERIDVSNPSEITIAEMKVIASSIKARVVGDDGEIYADFTIPSSPIKKDYRKVRKANLPEEFPIIDDFNKEEKIVTEMEILDLNDNKYRNINLIETELKQYIDRLASLSGVVWDDYHLMRGKEFNIVYLEIAIPAGKVTQDQKEKIYELQDYAQEKNVRLIICEVA